MLTIRPLRRTPRAAAARRCLVYAPVVPLTGDDEVEAKFRPSPAVVHAARRLASHTSTTRFTDRYFDTAAFALTTRDAWLRRRDDTWELKAPAHDLGAGVDHYTEFTAWTSIVAAARRISRVALPATLPTSPRAAEAALAHHGVLAFAAIRTTRERHVLSIAGHAVRVDVDAVEFLDGASAEGDSIVRGEYAIGEVELVAAAGGVAPADALAAVFDELGIVTASVRGKVLECLHRYAPAHFRALEASGLVAAKMGRRGA